MEEFKTISFADFEKVDIRVGKILEAVPFPEARNPSYKLQIDFGAEVGVKKSSAQITAQYEPEDLVGRQIVAVVNFPPKQIANMISEVLVLGVPNERSEVVLLKPDQDVNLGVKMY